MLQISQDDINSDVKACLNLYNEMDKLIETCFKKSSRLRQAVEESMSELLNAPETHMAFKVASFADLLLSVQLRLSSYLEVKNSLT